MSTPSPPLCHHPSSIYTSLCPPPPPTHLRVRPIVDDLGEITDSVPVVLLKPLVWKLQGDDFLLLNAFDAERMRKTKENEDVRCERTLASSTQSPKTM